MTQSANGHQREANVVLELRIPGPVSGEVLDANSDDVLDAVVTRAGDLALGPAIAVNVEERAIKLRFDVVATTNSEIHERIAEVLATIAHETDLQFESMRSAVETHGDGVETDPATLAAS